MGQLVITRRKGESIQLCVKDNPKIVLELVELFAHAAMFKMHFNGLSTASEIPYGSLQRFKDGLIKVDRAVWNGRKCESSVRMVFDLPRSVAISRTEWLERKGLTIEDLAK